MPKKQNGPRKIPDVHKLYIHAESFRLTSELLRNEFDQGKVCYGFAFIANEAFCCELFLKCLAAIRSQEHPSGHRLDKLYASLPKQDQDCVEQHYERLSAGDSAHEKAGQESPSKSNELRDFLADGADVFEAIRYWYERPFAHRRGNFRYPILAIREAILEICPGWRLQTDNLTKPKSSCGNNNNQQNPNALSPPQADPG